MRLMRLSGLAFAVGGALTLALSAAWWFLAFALAPFAIVQMFTGIMLWAGRPRWRLVAILTALFGIFLGVSLLGGFMAPVALATIACEVIGIVLVVTARPHGTEDEKSTP
jgi:hypothetical protein